MVQVLTAEWFGRSALEVAPDLVGCTLVRRLGDGRTLRGTIVETEAYQEGDPACHAYRKKTKRNGIMFGPAGYVYVYLIYGMYYCLNFVTDRDEFASAVLIRALQMEAVDSEQFQPQGKSKQKPDRLAAGPGKLCRVMEINLELYGTTLATDSPLWVEARVQPEIELIQTTRIGLTQGQDLPWRWYLKDCTAISKPG
jgi:DNA-3-methyladenine glycosylase